MGLEIGVGNGNGGWGEVGTGNGTIKRTGIVLTHLVVRDLQELEHHLMSLHVAQQPLLLLTVTGLAQHSQLHQDLG